MGHALVPLGRCLDVRCDSVEPVGGDELTASDAGGGVVWRRTDGNLEILIVYRERFDDWSLPKGAVEPGESISDAALREVSEETGVRCELGEQLPMTEWIREDGTLRRCYWWLMRPSDVGEPRRNDTVTQRAWSPMPEVLAVLSHERDRGVVRTALDYVAAVNGSIRGLSE